MSSPVFLKHVALSFLRAFLASLLVFLLGILTAPEWSFTKAAAVGALVGAVTAGIRAAQHLFESA